MGAYTCIGHCEGDPEKIENADGPSGSGSLEGEMRTFSCSGDFIWDDLSTAIKNSTCLAAGNWSVISERCKSRLFVLDFHPGFLGY